MLKYTCFSSFLLLVFYLWDNWEGTWTRFSTYRHYQNICNLKKIHSPHSTSYTLTIQTRCLDRYMRNQSTIYVNYQRTHQTNMHWCTDTNSKQKLQIMDTEKHILPPRCNLTHNQKIQMLNIILHLTMGASIITCCKRYILIMNQQNGRTKHIWNNLLPIIWMVFVLDTTWHIPQLTNTNFSYREEHNLCIT